MNLACCTAQKTWLINEDPAVKSDTSQRPQGSSVKVRCCIVGGGPAGMMLGYLLGRAGIDVVVLEKHADFFRDFRGDTVHPSTLVVMDELGLIDGFLKLPHQRLQKMDGLFGGNPFVSPISAASAPSTPSSPSCRNGIS
jgi:2-polyprenyl-6-methoxyphenol hydroxylase-like FAD-dependent oxidoreductase